MKKHDTAVSFTSKLQQTLYYIVHSGGVRCAICISPLLLSARRNGLMLCLEQSGVVLLSGHVHKNCFAVQTASDFHASQKFNFSA